MQDGSGTRDGVRLTTRGARTRERLIDAAADLVAQEPSATVGLERIARAAGVAKSSLLWHFGSKEQLYLEVVDRWFSAFQERVVAELGGGRDLREVLPLLIDAYVAFLQERPEANPVLFTLLFGSPKGGEVRSRIAEMYREFRRAICDNTRLGGQPVAEEDAALVVAALDGIFLQWFIDPQGFDHVATFARLREYLGRLEPVAGEAQ